MLQPETVTMSAEPVKPSALTSFLSGFLSKYATATESKVAQVGELQRKYPKPSGYNKYTYAEVAKHTTPEDCWLIVEDKVYDVSAMNHPGGEVVFSYGGRDATELFNVMHKNQPKVRTILKAYLIGEVSTPDQTALLKDWNAMRKDFEARGLMDASAVFYARKLVELVAMISTAAWLNFTYPSSVLAMLASAFLAATYLYQCGWTQHDFQHNQVFRSHKLNALVGGWVIGLGLGGSAHWWKTKHNQHHATPNKMHADTKAAVDPDIDTVPLIAWHEELVKQVPRADRGLISVQHILVWPLLLVALVNWQTQSMIHAFSFPGIPTKQRRYEIGMMVTHQAYMAFISFFPLGWKMGLLHWLLTHAMAGFVTSFVFIQSHNGMEIYTDDKDFVTSQLVSTRNIHPGVVSDWIMGGLNYQIEHHLFPTMPRHSFFKIRKELMQFCARHGLPYESCTTWESTVKVYNALKGIAKLA